MTFLTLCLHEAALHNNNNELQLRSEGQKGIMCEGKKKGKEKIMMRTRLFFPPMQHMNIRKAERIVLELSLFNLTMVPL